MAFARRNVMGKVAQTRLGVFVILIQAIILTLIMGMIISRAIKFDIDYPYLLFLLPGMCGWYAFSYLVSLSSMSLIQHQGIITKVAFPRISLPISFGLSVFADMIAWILVIIVLLIFYGVSPDISIVFLPLLMLMNVLTGLAIGTWIAILSVKNRDLVMISPLFIGLGVFFTPVFYPASILPVWVEKLLYFNPLAGVVEGYRCCFVTGVYDFNYLWGFLLSLILLSGSIFVFSKKEGVIADYL
jgi:lipopolysaccharide transport system permease protein